jgi:replication factor C subunit 3/5
MLRRVIEKYTKNTRFCLICNYIKKINVALQSRCTKFRFAPLNEKYIRIKTKEIIKKEKINVTSDGIETIIKRSHGDMRRILNILQATSMAYDEIDEDTVNNCIGYPSTKDMNIIFDSFYSDTFYNSSKLIEQYRYNNGYSLVDIIHELYNKLIFRIINSEPSATNENELKILELMAEIEYNTSSCTSETLQISSLVGIFKLVKENGLHISPSIA